MKAQVPDYLQKTKNIFHEPIVNEPFLEWLQNLYFVVAN